MSKLLYIGHGAVRIISNNGKVLYLDPFLGDGYDLEADYVLITHEHYDHTAIEKLKLKESTIIIRSFDMITSDGYKKINLDDFEVEATEAYNTNHKKSECVGYLIKVDGVLLYFSGDTSLTSQMDSLKERKIDYAFFCGDGIYNMNIDEASICAYKVQAKVSIPYHLYPDHLFDESLAERFTAPKRFIMYPNQEIEIFKQK